MFPSDSDDSCGTFPFAPPGGEGVKRGGSPDAAVRTETEDNREVNIMFESDVASALRSMKSHLCNIPHDEKSALIHVQRVQPDLVDDDHMLGFLKADNFDVDLAVKRLVRYWEHRCQAFGPDRYALPMTLDGAMKGRIDAIKKGFLCLLPVPDEAGRVIIYSNSSPYKNEVPEADEKIQVWWYLLHVAMEMPGALENGFVILANSRESRLNNFDSKWALAACSSGDRDFPIRWKIAHVCHANAVFPLVASAVKAVLSPEQRKSFILHNGDDERVLKSLAEYMLPAHCIPTHLGGSLRISTDEFIKERLEKEGVSSESIDTETNSFDDSEILGSADTGDLDGSVGNADPCVSGDNPIDSKGPVEVLPPIQAEVVVSKPAPKLEETVSAPTQAKKDAYSTAKTAPPSKQTKKKNSSKKPKGNVKKKATDAKSSHPGRSGDPRMKQAIQAKMDDPDLSLVDALKAGGYVFPKLDEPDAKIASVEDTDGITVYQRRNQLLRRLRLLKAKET